MVPSRPWKVRDKQARPRPVPRLALFGDNRGPVTREELRAEIQRRLWWDRWGNRLLLVAAFAAVIAAAEGRSALKPVWDWLVTTVTAVGAAITRLLSSLW